MIFWPLVHLLRHANGTYNISFQGIVQSYALDFPPRFWRFSAVYLEH